MTTLMVITMTMAAGPMATVDRIDLVEWARVVRYTGDSPETLEVRELERGPDGWEAWLGADGEYMIGVEWDEPRDLGEVCIEFRHAIANREQFKVQYWQHHWPSGAEGGWAPLDDPFHGQWVTAQAEWWAGDRDVSFAFVPYKQERGEDDAPDVRYRRTFRLQFLCGKEELPPVRYLRAYGPNKSAEATFDIRFDPHSKIAAPLAVSTVNGYVLSSDGEVTMTEARPSTSPANLTVRYASDDLDSPTRTVITVRDGLDATQGFSFLPAEVVRFGIIRIPSLGVVVAHRGSQADLQAGQAPGMSVFDRVSTEPEQTFDRARREIPELKKTQQRGRPLYLPLGLPDARQEVAVSYDGSILLERSALKIPADDTKRLNWPANEWMIRLSTGEPPFDHAAEGNVKQRLLEDYLPIVINSWTHGGIDYEQVCVATFLDGDPPEVRGDETVVLMVRLTARNSSNSPADAIVRLHIEPEEALTLDGNDVLASGTTKDGKTENYDRPRHRFGFSGPGEAKATIEPGGRGAVESTLVCRQSLSAGESAVVAWSVPFITLDSQTQRQQLARLDFDQVLAREADRWRRIIDEAAVIDVPDRLLNDFYKAQLSHILITGDRDPYNGTRVLPAATYSYNVCLNESCHQVRALEVRGLHDRAALFLDAVVKGQSSRGMHGRFTDKQGVLHGLPTETGDYQTFNYNLDHGFALWMLNEHYRFTRDRQWLEDNAEAMIAACDFVTRQCETPPEANALGKEDQHWGVGLLPPGHLEDPPEWLLWFAVNGYAYRGMQATAKSLAEIEHPEAARIAREAAVFGENLRDSCRESMIRAPVVRLRDGTYVPHQPTRSRLRGRDLGWIRDALYGPVHLIDCGIYADDSPEAEWILRDTEDNVFIGQARGRRVENYQEQWFSWGGITLQSNLLPNPLIYLRRGQPKHAIRAFYNSLGANVYADVRTFCEHPIKAYGWGAGPFFKSPDESAFIVWFRHLLICENGDALELLAGAPAPWFAPGKTIEVKNAATWFGPVSLRVASEDNPRRITVQLTGPQRNPPDAIRLHVRSGTPIRSVKCDGEGISTFDAQTGIVTLPGNIGAGTVVVSY